MLLRWRLFRYSGGFVPRPGNPWVYTTNSVFLQLNTNCTDVYGYADLVEVNSSNDRTETGVHRISFKGSLNLTTKKFEGTVYVDYDLTCQGSCEGYAPYSFNYPAVWNGQYDQASSNVTGWIDGYGDFKLDLHSDITPEEIYKNVPGLEIWP